MVPKYVEASESNQQLFVDLTKKTDERHKLQQNFAGNESIEKQLEEQRLSLSNDLKNHDDMEINAPAYFSKIDILKEKLKTGNLSKVKLDAKLAKITLEIKRATDELEKFENVSLDAPYTILSSPFINDEIIIARIVYIGIVNIANTYQTLIRSNFWNKPIV